MKLTKGVKTTGRKKAIAESLSDVPQRMAPLPLAEMKSAETKTTETTTVTACITKPVTIEAKIDVGFGNTLFLRGEGLGLSWSHGVPLTCVDGKTWKWIGESQEILKFKLLINDQVWSQGEDLVAKPGQRVEISPAF